MNWNSSADVDLAAISLPPNATLGAGMDVMESAGSYGLPKGICLVTDGGGSLVGVVTDGDVRRSLLSGRTLDAPLEDVMTTTPLVLPHDAPFEGLASLLEEQEAVTGRRAAHRHVVLVDNGRKPRGLVLYEDVESGRYTVSPIGMVGLGFAGLTLAVSLAERGLEVRGFDNRSEIQAALSKGSPHIYEPDLLPLLARQLEDARLVIATEIYGLKGCRTFVIAVNTPVDSAGEADLSFLQAAVEDVAGVIEPGNTVIVRSTVPVGTCRGLIKETIERTSTLEVGRDIGLAFAPERSVAGRALEELRQLPQVIGGIDQRSVDVAERVFSPLSPSIVKVDKMEEAELVKLVNNTFRDVSFAFANTVATISSSMGLDARRVILAANSGYPRNPVALPSPGVGGSCLTKDPYLFAKCEGAVGLQSLARVARAVNESMPIRLADRLTTYLSELGKEMDHTVAYVMGIAFKGEPETNDLRFSPGLDFARRLKERGARIEAWDAVAKQVDAPPDVIDRWRDPVEGFSGCDVVAILNNHRFFSTLDLYDLIGHLNRPGIVLDPFNFFDKGEVERIAGIRYMDLSTTI